MTVDISISGELGSGKTSVAHQIAAATGQRVVSGGDIHRAFATSHGISTVELNLLAETDPEIDDKIDGEWLRLAETDEPLIFDSRLAWHFAPQTFSIHLIVDSQVAANRLFAGRSSPVEKYADEADAAAGVFARQESEQRRFLEKYGVDTWRLANYDLVVDTSRADVATVTALILDRLRDCSPPHRVYVDPRRILPSEVVADPSADPPPVAYVRPFFVALGGRDALSRALEAGESLIPVELVAEGSEPLPHAGGVTAEEYLASLSGGVSDPARGLAGGP